MTLPIGVVACKVSRLHTVTFEDLADYALAGQMVMRTCIHELYLNIGKVKKAAQGLCGFKL